MREMHCKPSLGERMPSDSQISGVVFLFWRIGSDKLCCRCEGEDLASEVGADEGLGGYGGADGKSFSVLKKLEAYWSRIRAAQRAKRQRGGR